MISNEVVSAFVLVDTRTMADELDRRSSIFKALGEKNRLKLLYVLRGGEKCVSELLPFFNINQPTVSIHLLMLEELGLVSARREGRRRYYRLASDEIIAYLNRFCESVEAP